MKSRWRALAAMSWQERGRTWRAWMALLMVQVGLRLLPFGTVRRLAQGRPRKRPSPGPAEARATIEEWQLAIRRAARYRLTPMRCLVQALATQWLLGRGGIATSLRFGIQKTSEGLAAHAWLEYGGQPTGEAQPVEERFARLAVVGAERQGTERSA